MKHGRLAVAILGLAAAAAATPAVAQDDKGLYLGASVGYVQFKNICKEALVPCDEQDTGYRGYLGYQFNRYVAAEFGYGNLGSATGEGPLPGGTGKFEAEVKDVFDLSAMFSIPVTNRLFGLGRVGFYRARATVEMDGPFPGIASPSHEAGTSTGFTYGLGAEYRLGWLGLRAEWQRYDNVGVGSTGEDDIDVMSIGVLFRF
jgi:OmpA-OmpF porin, OOP family